MKKAIYIVLLLAFSRLAAGQAYTLEQCITMAKENSYVLKNSRLDYEMAEQTKKEAFTKYFPVVSAAGLTFSASEYMIDENIDLSALGQIFARLGMDPSQLGLPSSMPVQKIDNGTVAFIGATQPVFTGGQILNGNKLARVGRDVSRLKISLSEDDVVSKTEEYFWNIVSLKEKIKTLEYAEKQLGEIHKSASLAVDAGVTNKNDLLRVELQQQSIESSRIKVENGIKILKLLLCNQTGAPREGFDISPDSLDEVKEPTQYYVPAAEGLSRRTEKELLDKAVEAASLQHKMALGKNMPTVAAGAGYAWHNLMDRDVDFGMLYATVSLPISSWWGASHAIRREKLNMTKAENERINMENMMEADIEAKWNDLQEAWLQTLVARKSTESASENLRICDDSYKAGTVSLTNLLEARTLLQQSHDQYTDACTGYYLKLTLYLHATGRKGLGQ